MVGSQKLHAPGSTAAAAATSKKSPARPPAGGLLGLQQTAGNLVVQRLLATPAAALDAHMGESKASRTRAVFGAQSSYAAIRKTLGDYEQATAPGSQVGDRQKAVLLGRLSRQCTAWLNAHRGQQLDQRDQDRRKIISDLHDQVEMERVKLSQSRYHDVYLDSVAGSSGLANLAKQTPIPEAHKFYALSSGSGNQAWNIRDKGVEQERKDRLLLPDNATPAMHSFVEDKKASFNQHAQLGITPAEQSAIYSYTDSNYYYMNPAAAGSDSWLEATRNKFEQPFLALDKKMPDNQKANNLLRTEGAVHTAMANSGLMKLPPYQGLSYRGETLSRGDFAALKLGMIKRSPNIVSTSKAQNTPVGFLSGNLAESRRIGVLWAYANAGGRDVTLLSANAHEQEVALPPGAGVRIERITKVGRVRDADRSGAPQAYRQMMRSDRLKDRAVYVIQVTAAG